MRVEINTIGLTGKVVTREHRDYEMARTMWNRGIEKYPLAIVYCTNKEDVVNSVRWARTHEVPIRIRSGGHHYAGFSTGNDVLVIDVSQMNGISIDEKAGQVSIEGGVRNRELYEFLCGKGYPFPGGGCPSVGVVGFTLGGGWGYSSRLLGLACDGLRQIELIDYEGNLLVASEKEHADLFWAVRGSGGGQFGVVVSMTFDLPEKRNETTLIRLEYSNVTPEEQINMFKLWQGTIRNLCPEVNFKLSFYNSKEKGIGMLLIGVYYGAAKEAHEIVEPFIKIGHKIQMLIQPMTVLEVNRWIQDAHPDFEHYKSSGRFVNEPFSEEEMQVLLDMINERSEGAVYTAVSCYGMGGNIKNVPQDEMAFYYRDSLYILGFQTVWEDNTYSLDNEEWFIERFKEIEQLTCGSFVNFPTGEIENYPKAYYGIHSERLHEIKKEYDPSGVFNFEQSL